MREEKADDSKMIISCLILVTGGVANISREYNGSRFHGKVSFMYKMLFPKLTQSDLLGYLGQVNKCDV